MSSPRSSQQIEFIAELTEEELILRSAAELVDKNSIAEALKFHDVLSRRLESQATVFSVILGERKDRYHFALAAPAELTIIGKNKKEITLLNQAFTTSQLLLAQIGWEKVPKLSAILASGVQLATLLEAKELSKSFTSLDNTNKKKKYGKKRSFKKAQ